MADQDNRPPYYGLTAMRPAASVRNAGPVIVRCLLVDDNASFLETAKRILEREGIVVSGTASCSAEAMQQAGELRPDVVVVDIGLGTEDGFDLARDLAAQGIAVIMTSTRAEDDYAELIEESPAAGFLAKTELSAAAILRLLGAPPA